MALAVVVECEMMLLAASMIRASSMGELHIMARFITEKGRSEQITCNLAGKYKGGLGVDIKRAKDLQIKGPSDS